MKPGIKSNKGQLERGQVMSEKTEPVSEAGDRSPEKLSDLEVTEPQKMAAGMKAITRTMRDAYGKMGFVRGNRALI